MPDAASTRRHRREHGARRTRRRIPKEPATLEYAILPVLVRLFVPIGQKVQNLRPSWAAANGRADFERVGLYGLTAVTQNVSIRVMDPTTRANRIAWETASLKYVREHDDLLFQAASGSSLTAAEQDLLEPLLRSAPDVVHLQSGHGLEDAALVQAGARSVVGIDYSNVAVGAAQRRANELGLPCRYIIGSVPAVPLAHASADLVYTGKGAIMWMPNLDSWADDVVRLLRPSGHLFVYEEHPAAVLWTRDEDRPRIRDDRSYFGRSHINDTFPARGAVQWQWTLGKIVTAIASVGLQVMHLSEHSEPFWQPGGLSAAAWGGRLPNSFALLARMAP
jgi:SAM-dependent methyltransferase